MARLIRETGGVAPGAIYVVSGSLAAMVWSPHWRGSVVAEERLLSVGVLGRGAPLGWPERGGSTVPFFVAQEVLGEVDDGVPSVDMVTDALVRLGIWRP